MSEKVGVRILVTLSVLFFSISIFGTFFRIQRGLVGGAKNVSAETAKEIKLNERLEKINSEEKELYYMFVAPKEGTYYASGGTNQLKFTKEKLGELTTIKDYLKTGWLLKKGDTLYFVGGSLDFSGFKITNDEEEVVLSGYACNDEGQPLINEKLELSLKGKVIEELKTDEEGYFFIRLAIGKDYRFVGKEFDITLTTETGEFDITEQKKGYLVLEQEMTEGSNSLDLKSDNIYLTEDEIEKKLDEEKNQMEVSKDLDIRIGDILVIPASDEYPGGIAVKVKTITETNGTKVLTLEKPEIHEVVDEISVGEETLDIGEGEFIPAEGVTIIEE